MEKITSNNQNILNCEIAPDVQILGECYLKDCKIEGGTIVKSSYIEGSQIGKNCQIGPFANIRPNCTLEDNIRVGNFVELKNCVIKSGTKIAHLTYVGDAEIGKNCNLGCGVVFCNFDGKNKHRTIVEEGVFIGSNVNLIAPIKIGKNSFIAAGSTVTKEVPENTFIIARTKQENKPKR